MWGHKVSCQDYQDLIDRGWRRYCYTMYYTVKMNSQIIPLDQGTSLCTLDYYQGYIQWV